MPHAGGTIDHPGEPDLLITEFTGIPFRDLPFFFRKLLHMGQPDPQQPRLKLVQPGISAYDLVIVAFFTAVVAEDAELFAKEEEAAAAKKEAAATK